MNYNKIKKYMTMMTVAAFASVGIVSCIDEETEEFIAPTGNVNNIQPNTIFTTSEGDDDTSFVFRSFSTDATSYLWDFGDGNTSTEANPTYSYSEGGVYNVKLTTVSSDNLTAIDSSYVNPVVLDFNYSAIDTQVTFENTSTGVESLDWDFGDGSTLSWDSTDGGEVTDENYNPVYSYTDSGTFDVTLTATTFLGKEVTITKSVEDLVLATIPDFSFDVNGLEVVFTDESFLAESYSWDFGDGSAVSTEASPVHTFPAEGTYDITLTTTNSAGVSRSITKPVPVGAVKPTFAVEVLNSECNDHTATTGDNADAWDMTPNSTVIDDVLGEIDSPYRAIWYNTDLNAYIDATYCTNEQPGSTSDGNKFGPNAGGGRGVKLSNSCRRLYQVVTVEPGVVYTFTIDTRSEAEGINTEVFILNNEITTEVGIMDNVDAYYNITNDFNTTKSSSTNDTFTTTTFTFEATSNIAVIYVRALNAVDSSNEVFIDNIDILTPGF